MLTIPNSTAATSSIDMRLLRLPSRAILQRITINNNNVLVSGNANDDTFSVGGFLTTDPFVPNVTLPPMLVNTGRQQVNSGCSRDLSVVADNTAGNSLTTITGFAANRGLATTRLPNDIFIGVSHTAGPGPNTTGQFKAVITYKFLPGI